MFTKEFEKKANAECAPEHAAAPAKKATKHAGKWKAILGKPPRKGI